MSDVPADRRRWPFRPRLPSFRTAAFGSITVLLALVGWAFVDASFENLLAYASSFFESGSNDFESYDLLLVGTWSDYGIRVPLFATLLVLAVTFAGLMLWRLLFGQQRERSLRALLITFAVAGLWLTFILSYQPLTQAGFQWRVQRMIPAAARDAEILFAEWPTEEGRLPFSGKYLTPDDDWMYMDNAGFLSAKYNPFPITEPVVDIGKADCGGIRFGIGTVGTMLEYHPGERQPTSFTYTIKNPNFGGDVQFTMREFVELEPRWFLVRYSVADVP